MPSRRLTLPEIRQVQRQTSTCRIALTNYPTSRWLTTAANNRIASAARSQVGSDRPIDRRDTRASGVSSGRVDATYRSAHSSTSQLAAAQAGGQVGDSIMTAKNSHTAHGRETLLGHRPMPCHGAVNASMNSNQAALVVQGAGHPNSSRVNVYTRIRYGDQLECPTTAQTAPSPLVGLGCSRG